MFSDYFDNESDIWDSDTDALEESPEERPWECSVSEYHENFYNGCYTSLASVLAEIVREQAFQQHLKKLHEQREARRKRNS